ncbi:MAG: hypothetical protein EPN53_09965 [Acidobacteria bacterium]|nr:MAG: hypothetical protein EPN53_09965 [Acidobacteriota bacterium]
MSQPSVDAEDLVTALENHSYEMSFFLDRRTGEVFPVFEDNDESDDDRARIDGEPARFVAVEPIPSSVGWEVMAAFVESLPPGGPRAALGSALGARHPFRAFKDVLSAFPGQREAWYAFHDREWTRLAAEWLEAEGIDATLKLRSRALDGGVAGDQREL